MTPYYTEKAKQDLEIAFSWYETQKHGLGIEFLDCIEATIETIIGNPDLYPKCHRHFRRALIRRFPFSIFYTVETSLIIHAIFDNRQDPDKLPM